MDKLRKIVAAAALVVVVVTSFAGGQAVALADTGPQPASTGGGSGSEWPPR